MSKSLRLVGNSDAVPCWPVSKLRSAVPCSMPQTRLDYKHGRSPQAIGKELGSGGRSRCNSRTAVLGKSFSGTFCIVSGVGGRIPLWRSTRCRSTNLFTEASSWDVEIWKFNLLYFVLGNASYQVYNKDPTVELKVEKRERANSQHHHI